MKRPASRKSLIAEEYRDCDGYWIYLKPGYRVGPELLHGITEDTKHDAYRTLADVVPCDCEECLVLLKSKAKAAL